MPSQQTLIYLLLALAFLTFIFWSVRDWITQRKDKEKQQAIVPGQQDKTSIVLPLQLQAYERLVVFVERLSPDNLIHRINQPGMSAGAMHLLLIQTVKAEFDHNVSQQVYVSRDAWNAVRNVKEQLINIINQISAHLPENATASDLNKKLLELMLQTEEPFPTQTAQEILNHEAKRLMKS